MLSLNIYMDNYDKIIVTRLDGVVIGLLVNDEDISGLDKEEF